MSTPRTSAPTAPSRGMPLPEGITGEHLLARLTTLKQETCLERWTEDGVPRRARRLRWTVEMHSNGYGTWTVMLTDNAARDVHNAVAIGIHVDLWQAVLYVLHERNITLERF